MISKISFCLEVGPQGTGAFAPECPGCWVFAKTKNRALKKARVAVDEWFEWMKKYKERVPEIKGKFKIEVAELLWVNYNPVDAGKPEPLFWSEVLPVKKDDIKRTLKLMDYSRQDLLALVSPLTREQLDWKPPGEPRSIRNCLRHIAIVEPWYTSRLNIEIPEDYPKNFFKLLNYTRKIVLDCLSDFSREKMKGVFIPQKYKSPVCDLWTARKVLRRLVDHERLHTKYIQKVVKMYKKEKRLR
jgi:predicted RNase H-like HicB family nuclease